jgi:hypothetical protein
MISENTVKITGFASDAEIAESVRRTGAKEVNDLLVELAIKFRNAAMLIDPTITGCWLGHDVDQGLMHWIHLERPATPFVSNGARTPVHVDAVPDALVSAIEKYRDGLARFNETQFPDSESGAMIGKTYGPPMEALKEWDKPAVTRKGAVEALRLAADEMEQFVGSDVARAMVEAALDYLDRKEGSVT